MAVIVVSACLLGCECRYQGDHCQNEAVLSLKNEHTLVGVCPEQLGGLPTPRPPAEIQGTRVVNAKGADVTAAFTKGAEAALQLAKTAGATYAVLKARSPSCGKGRVYDGHFCGCLRDGNGVTADSFLQNGIAVYTEEELPALLNALSGSAQ